MPTGRRAAPISCASRIPGSAGKFAGGVASTLGIIGRLGGIGARPTRIGLVSDGDGAIAAIAAALELAEMQRKGDTLPGDVIVTTHICPNAPTRPHDPVDFMDSPIDDVTMNDNEVVPEADAILSIDTTKGNRIINHKGYALSPTVKEGYILRVAEDLLRIMEMTSGRPAVTFPITTQDITPYGNGVHHLNSILQPLDRYCGAGGRRGDLQRIGGAGLRHRRQPRNGHRAGGQIRGGSCQRIRPRHLPVLRCRRIRPAAGAVRQPEPPAKRR